MSDASDTRPDDDLTLGEKLDPICDAYEKAWLKDERPRIEDFLARVEKSAQPNLLRELLLLEIEYRSRSGETLGVDEYVDRFPDDAELVRQWAAREFARLAGAISPATAPQLLGDYELLETLGAGGMGVVYRAKQRSANREVALKVIRSDRIAPQHDGTPAPATERFWTEAQAAARLEHEGIVTVYDVGEVEGQPFFSMRLVDGQSLGDMLRDGPLGNDAAAKYLRDVARAIEEAHRQGILHRDLKPQNVLIDAKTDRALVADFGLAKMIEDDSELTRHGEVMGTPQYMSPEQARDASTVSTAADIYSTGATMYHALTGRPPFLAASAMDTVQQVINEEPLPPRRLNRAIDRDLETICLKCLEKDPPRRYQTSAEVADELHRFLERQPIRARPVGVAGHVWRWSRRKPALAAMSLVALLLAIAAATGIGVGYRRSEAARQSTAAGFADASLALDNFVNEIRGDERLNSPELRPLKEELLRRAVQYYEQFLAKRAADENLSSQVARTYYQVGLIYEDIATTEQAQTAYERAADLQRKRVAAQPGGVELLAQTGDTLNALGRVYVKTAQAPRAEATLQECIATRESAVRLADANTHPLRRQFRRQLANSHMNLGILKKNLDDPSGALQQYQAAQGFRLQLLDEDQNDLNSRRDLGIGYYNIANLQSDRGDEMEAVENYQRAVDQLSGVEWGMTERNAIFTLVVSLRLLGDLSVEYEEAKSFYAQAAEKMGERAKAHPEINHWQQELAQIAMNRGQLEFDAAMLQDAADHLATAETILLRLRGEDAERLSYQRNLARTWHGLGLVRAEQTETKLAVQTLRRAEELMAAIVAGGGDEFDADALAEIRATLASLDP